MKYADTPKFWEWFVRDELLSAAYAAVHAIKSLRGLAQGDLECD